MSIYDDTHALLEIQRKFKRKINENRCSQNTCTLFLVAPNRKL